MSSNKAPELISRDWLQSPQLGDGCSADERAGATALGLISIFSGSR